MFSQRRTARAGWGDWLGNGKIAPGSTTNVHGSARVRPEPLPTCLDRYLANDVHQIVFLVAPAVFLDLSSERAAFSN